MKLVICGGRTKCNRPGAYSVLDTMLDSAPADEPFEIAQGEAVGYDLTARAWAERFSIKVTAYAIDNKLDGYRDDAPKKRNTRMFHDFKPDACLAFPGGPGTRHMFSLCYDALLPVYDVEFKPDQNQFSIWLLRKKREAALFRQGAIT